MTEVEPTKRILCIDGGGIKGAFPAAFLAAIERKTGKRCVDYFDLIAGTSTGGIIALGLALGIPAEKILDFYKDHGPRIFARSTSQSLTFKEALEAGIHQASSDWGWTSSKYDTKNLHDALEDIVGTRILGDCETRLVIPSYKSETHGLHVYKTAHHPRLETDYKDKIIDIAMATAAAPTYFSAHNYEGGSGLIDGGIWANNPSGMAAVEAVGLLQWEPKSISMLSLGCSEQFLPPNKSVGILGAIWNGWILNLMFRGQDRASIGTAKILLNYPHENNGFIRINPTLGPEYAKLDNTKIIDGLIGIANGEARSYIGEIKSRFFGVEKDKFEPFYR